MQTIGERLEEARKRKGISIREAAEGTKILATTCTNSKVTNTTLTSPRSMCAASSAPTLATSTSPPKK